MFAGAIDYGGGASGGAGGGGGGAGLITSRSQPNLQALGTLKEIATDDGLPFDRSMVFQSVPLAYFDRQAGMHKAIPPFGLQTGSVVVTRIVGGYDQGKNRGCCRDGHDRQIHVLLYRTQECGTDLNNDVSTLPVVMHTPYGPVKCGTGNAVIIGPAKYG